MCDFFFKNGNKIYLILFADENILGCFWVWGVSKDSPIHQSDSSHLASWNIKYEKIAKVQSAFFISYYFYDSMIIFYFPDIHHDDERRRMPPVPPQKPNFAGNKSFYRKSLIIASPLNFRQKSCPGNIFWGMGFGQRGSLRWNSFEGILVQTFLSFEKRCICITPVWECRYILHPKKLSLFKFVRN